MPSTFVVVQHVVLEPPHEGAGAQTVGHVGDDPVEALTAGEGAMVGVVHDARGRCDQPGDEHRSTDETRDQAAVGDDERPVARSDESGDEDGLDVQASPRRSDLGFGWQHRTPECGQAGGMVGIDGAGRAVSGLGGARVGRGEGQRCSLSAGCGRRLAVRLER